MTSIAIVIPTLNRAPLLRGAIASALRCEPRLIERNLPNAASARNVGLSKTSSRFVGFLDSDDEALPEKTGGLIDPLDSRREIGLVHGAIRVIDSRGTLDEQQTSRLARAIEGAKATGTSYAALASRCLMYTSATMMRREAVEQIGGFDETLDTYEDWDLYLRLSLEWRLEYVDSPAAKYRVWPGNVAWDRTARGLCEVAEKHLDMLGSVSEEMRGDAEWGLLRRLASSRYTLVELADARAAAWAALRSNPRRAIMDVDLRRVLTRGWLPSRIIERRRDARSS
jgi:hypothetical protein